MIQQGNTGFDLAIKNNFFDKETYNKICEDVKEQKTLTKNIDLQGDLAKKIIKKKNTTMLFFNLTNLKLFIMILEGLVLLKL